MAAAFRITVNDAKLLEEPRRPPLIVTSSIAMTKMRIAASAPENCTVLTQIKGCLG